LIVSELDNELRSQAEILAQVNAEMKLSGRLTPETQALLAAGSKESLENIKLAVSHSHRALNALQQNFTRFTQDVYRGEQGMKGMDGVFDGLSGAADSAAKAFWALGGPLGIAASVISGIISATVKVAKAVGANADREFEAYQRLSRAGAVASDGMRATTEDARRLGLHVGELDKFVEIVTTNSQDLALFGGSAARGREILGRLGQGIQDQREIMLRLGISVEQQADGLRGFMSQQVQSGQTNTMTFDQLTAAARDYIYEMNELTRITGVGRKDIEDMRKRALEEEQFLAATRLAENERAGSGKNLQDLNDMLMATFKNSPEIAKGVRDMARGFAGTSKEANNLMLSGVHDLPQILQRVKTGELKSAEAADLIEKRLVEAGPKTLSAALLNAGKDFYVSQTAVRQAEANQARKLAEQKNKASADTLRAARGDWDKATANAASKEIKDRQIKTIFDEVGDNFIGPLGKAMSGMLGVVDDLVDGLSNLVNWFAGRQRGSEDRVARVQQQIAENNGKLNSLLTKAESERTIWDRDQINHTRRLLRENEKQLEIEKKNWEETKKDPEYQARQARAERRRQREAEARGETYTPPEAAGAAPTGAVEPGQVSAAGVKDPTAKLLDHISQKESRGSYNILVGGRTEPNLTKMTVAEVLDYQHRMLSGVMGRFESSAVGKYQIIRSTLLDLISRGKASPNDLYDATTQEKLGRGLLEKRGLEKYLSGRLSKDAFMDSLAMEWASLPYHTGRSYYAGVGSNRSLMSRDDFGQLFMARGGIATQPSIAGEAGPEAVIPLQNGRVPVDLSQLLPELVQHDIDQPTPEADTTDSDDWSDAVARAVAQIQQTNSVEQEILDLLEMIDRSNNATVTNNRKIHRAQVN
jgi:hypothetical protein